MKKILAIVCLCGLSIAAFAQEEKPESDKKASPELSALQTAASLAKYGYENYYELEYVGLKIAQYPLDKFFGDFRLICLFFICEFI